MKQIIEKRWLSRLKKALILLLISFICSGILTSNALADDHPDVFLRTSLEPKNPIVGQQVTVNVDVFVNSWFAKAPQFSDIQIDDTIAFLPPNATLNLTKRIKNQTYAGQRHSYFLFPQLPGRYYLPTISVKIIPGGGTGEAITLSTQETSFMAQLPSKLASESSDPIIATSNLEVKTEVNINGNSELKSLQVGDTIERIVTIAAVDTLATFLPSINPGDTSGLAAYPDPPLLTNRFERGQLTAIRSDRISYIASEPGRYQLPSLSIIWWNTQTQSLEKTDISKVKIRVKTPLKQLFIQGLIGLTGVIFLLGIFFYYRQKLQLFYQNYQQKRSEDEPVIFQRLRQATLNNNAQKTWRELLKWLNSTTKDSKTLTVNDFLSQVKDPSLTQEIKQLEALLFGKNSNKDSNLNWSGAKLEKSIHRVRKHWLHLASKTSQMYSIDLDILPPLNPHF
ncbi:BatD family protein [Crocosphaera chwakensis]|uniref:DUF7939 domain-containing protein n=1 Tax=Crocosphaera chwakensis CCY0110 TaxID=391612 RepID=A3IME0_9CHRO|nr:BatD family protein [Crocosphaera chwakensis]EAZ92309.1 hypothetical protein CY0110_28159 [Crocosphaera chwakensis CCY0110]